MKTFKYFAALLAMIFGMSVGSQAQCTDEGSGCGPWVDAAPIEFEYPGFPGCTITLYCKVQVCNGHKNFQVSTMSIPMDGACASFLQFILPEGIGGMSRQEVLFNASVIGSNELMKLFVEADQAAASDPDMYDCGTGNFLTYSIYFMGGCSKYVYAIRPATAFLGSVAHWRLAKCVEGGCCILTRTYCCNPITKDPELQTEEWTYVGDKEDCTGSSPIEDPFENYGSEWIRYVTYEPCSFHCYIY